MRMSRRVFASTQGAAGGRDVEEGVVVRKPCVHGRGAESAMNADREFAQSWFPRFEGTPIHDFKADGIGERSWAVRADTTNGGFASIGWTRGNLVLSVYVSCFPCHSDVRTPPDAGPRRSIAQHPRARADFG